MNGPCPRRLRRDALAGGRRDPGAPRRATPVLADDTVQVVLLDRLRSCAVSLVAAGCSRSPSGTTSGCSRPKYRGADVSDARPAGDARPATAGERRGRPSRPDRLGARRAGRAPRRRSRAARRLVPRRVAARRLRRGHRRGRGSSSPSTPGCARPGPARAQVVDRADVGVGQRRVDAAPARAAHRARRRAHGARARSRRSAGGSPAPRPACCSATSRSACSVSTTCSCSTTTTRGRRRLLRRRQRPRRSRSASRSARATSGSGSRSTRSPTGRSSPACRG